MCGPSTVTSLVCSLVDTATTDTLPETFQTWLHLRQPFRLFAFSSSKQALCRDYDRCAHRIAHIAAMNPPLPLTWTALQAPVRCGFLGNGGLKSTGCTQVVHRVWWVTDAGARAAGWTHAAVHRCAAGASGGGAASGQGGCEQGRADEGDGGEGVGCWAHKRCLCFLLGVAAQQLTGSVLSRVGQPCDGQWTEIALVDLCARSWAGAIF